MLRSVERTGAVVVSVALSVLAIALLVGCQSAPEAAPPPPPSDNPSNDRDLAAAMVMADTFQNMQRLTQAAPAEQAEIVSAARDAYQRAPRAEAQLRYALLLATPGHPARDPELARRLLRELAAQPEALVPVERAVVMVQLAQLDHELDLVAVNQELQSDARRTDLQRSATDQRRLLTQEDENARLRKELEADQAKLDAIAAIERNLTERKTGAEAGTEAGATGATSSATVTPPASTAQPSGDKPK